MTRRLESSARDYAIACIARGLPPESLPQFADEYSRAVQEVADEERARRRDYAPLPGAFADRVAISRNCTAYARRLVRARVALYLRTVRRAEAWERGESWANPPFAEPCSPAIVWRPSAWSARWLAYARPVPWRPLWTSAPPHAPGVTASMRREAPGPEVVT